MMSDQQLRGLMHQVSIQGELHMPGAVCLKGQWRTAVDDMIAIVAFGGGKTRLKFF